MKSISGFSITEVLISLFLASLIMTSVSQLYLRSKDQYLQIQTIVSNQLDLLWLNDLLSDSIRRAGFTPCLNINELPNKDKKLADIIINQQQQMLQVNRMSEHFTQVIEIRGSNQILVDAKASINPKRPIMLADCSHAEIQNIERQNKSGQTLQLTLSRPIYFSYHQPIYISEWIEEQWLIRPNAQGIPALYYQLGQAEELSPLVHSLQVRAQNAHDKTVLEIILGLDENQVHKMYVTVRGS